MVVIFSYEKKTVSGLFVLALAALVFAVSAQAFDSFFGSKIPHGSLKGSLTDDSQVFKYSSPPFKKCKAKQKCHRISKPSRVSISAPSGWVTATDSFCNKKRNPDCWFKFGFGLNESFSEEDLKDLLSGEDFNAYVIRAYQGPLKIKREYLSVYNCSALNDTGAIKCSHASTSINGEVTKS